MDQEEHRGSAIKIAQELPPKLTTYSGRPTITMKIVSNFGLSSFEVTSSSTWPRDPEDITDDGENPLFNELAEYLAKW